MATEIDRKLLTAPGGGGYNLDSLSQKGGFMNDEEVNVIEELEKIKELTRDAAAWADHDDKSTRKFCEIAFSKAHRLLVHFEAKQKGGV